MRRALLGIGSTLVMVLAAPGWARADDPAASVSPGQFSPAELEQLTAPIALYPDTLITQILIAATYPVDVVKAARWLADPQHAALTGDALTAALAAEDWDVSVKSLVPFPRILQQMDASLAWTEKLGKAFLAQQAEVMDAVQRLRVQARAAGNLATNDKQTVRLENQIVIIEPVSPAVVFVPVYDPWFVYGRWPYPAYPPFTWGPPPGVFVGGWWWGPGVYVVAPLWGWGWYDWYRRDVYLDRQRYNRIQRRTQATSPVWRHEPGRNPPPPTLLERPAPHRPSTGSGPGVVPRTYRLPPRPPVAPLPLVPAPRVSPPAQSGGGAVVPAPAPPPKYQIPELTPRKKPRGRNLERPQDEHGGGEAK